MYVYMSISINMYAKHTLFNSNQKLFTMCDSYKKSIYSIKQYTACLGILKIYKYFSFALKTWDVITSSFIVYFSLFSFLNFIIIS